METKKLALYFGLSDEVIGVRECLHSWEEGDVIYTDGVRTEIYAVFNSTEENMAKLLSMFKELNTNTAMGYLKNFDPDEDETWMFGDEEDILPYMVCNQNTVKKRVWSDYEKRLDYMEECVELIA